ncbi:aldo/keto reductase [Kitasatospora sp. NPDC101447]|uniref:aldo/keto reductase n=1 Tax=Kitasatospora sp. NPDC101447 TaxID=3364102 RepID=UPI003811D1D3
MERRRLPGLSREVSAIGAGCWTIGGLATNRGVPIGWAGVDEAEAFAGLVRSHDLGVTLYDTADVYGLGRSERLVGRLLAQVNRNRLTISSKVGYFADTAAHPYAAAQMRRQLLTSLTNLGTDYLDLYFLHSSDFGPDDQYLGEAVETVQRLRRDALVRAIGMRAPHTFAVEWATDPSHPQADESARFLKLFDRIQPDVLTVRYNLLSPLYEPGETDIFSFARQRRVGLLLKQVLGQGLLIGVHQPAAPMAFPNGDHRQGGSLFTAATRRAIHDGLAELRQRFGTSRADLARVAIRYALQRDDQAAVLLGFRNAQQIGSNLTCLGEPLSSEDIGAIQTAMSSVRAMLAPSQPITASPTQQEQSA